MLESVIVINSIKKTSKTKLFVTRWKHSKIANSKYSMKSKKLWPVQLHRAECGMPAGTGSSSTCSGRLPTRNCFQARDLGKEGETQRRVQRIMCWIYLSPGSYNQYIKVITAIVLVHRNPFGTITEGAEIKKRIKRVSCLDVVRDSPNQRIRQGWTFKASSDT